MGPRRYARNVNDPLDSAEFTVPLYTQRETANLVCVPANTFHHWARGYLYKTIAGEQRTASPLVTASGLGRGPVVPFVGLGEAYVLAAFRRTGVPMQRIRPAIAWLETNIGLRAALTSERLKSDGAEVLYDFARSHSGDPAAEPLDELVVVRNQQAVFRDVIPKYLQTITYRDGRLSAIRTVGYTPETSGSLTSSFTGPPANRWAMSPPTSVWTRAMCEPSSPHDVFAGRTTTLPGPRARRPDRSGWLSSGRLDPHHDGRALRLRRQPADRRRGLDRRRD